MKIIFNIYSLHLLTVLCTERSHATKDQCEASTDGTNFIFGIMGFYSQFNDTKAILLITTTTQHTPAHVRVTAPFINFDSSYTVTTYIVIQLNGTLSQVEARKQFKGIEVHSDVNISLTVVTDTVATGCCETMEGFLALPVNALGTRYIAASYYPHSSSSSEILIVGVENNTDVILSTMLDGHMGSNRTFRLQKFEFYQFKSNNVSGSVITSTKPVSVYSGSALYPGSLVVRKQFSTEQMIPTKYWTAKFIIPPIYPRKYFVLKIHADQDKTEVYYYNSTKYSTMYMNRGTIEELLFHTDPVVVLSNKPVSIIQYGHAGDNIDGDPFMTNVQGIAQFEDSYQFAAGRSTIAITVLKNSTNGLLLNGYSVSYWNVKNVPVARSMEEYVTLFVNVSSSDDYFHLNHSDGIKFGAVLHARVDDISFSYPLRLLLTDRDCKSHIGRFTTAPVSTHPESTVVTTHGSQNINKGNGTWCFTCEGMTHLQYCDEVGRCQSENEVCYVQRYPRSLNVNLYRSGCMHSGQCNNGHGADSCLECCSGNFCNSKGCGDKGLPVKEHRGPLCFDCTHKGEDEDCNTVQLCLPNQTCMVAKYIWGLNDYHYIMGCSENHVCRSKRSQSQLTTRHAPICTHCCHNDFCNMNCTSVNTSPAIIG